MIGMTVTLRRPTFEGIAHLAVTVRDMEATAAWWERHFGFGRLHRVDEPPGEMRHPRILLRHEASGLVLGIHEPHDRSGDAFDPSRTGLDHVSFAVAERSELQAWMEQLDANGIAHSPVRSTPTAEFVSLADPDGIQIELWWAEG